MRVKMRTIMAGPRGCARPGQTIEVDQATGEALVGGGYAELIAGTMPVPIRRTKPVPERLIAPPPPQKTAAPIAAEPAATAVAPEPAEAATAVEPDEPDDEAVDEVEEVYDPDEDEYEDEPDEADANEAHDPTLDELGLDARDAELLREAGLLTRTALEQYDVSEGLEAIRGIGKITAGEIRAAIDLSYEEE